jgi:hypothetical protein
MWIGFTLLTFIPFIPLAIVAAYKLSSKFSFGIPSLRRVLIVASLVKLFGHKKTPFK